MTDVFVIVIFAVIVVYDIFLKARKKKTVTEIMRSWYETFPFTPFAVAVIFLGHFLALMPWEPTSAVTIIGLSVSGSVVLTISIVLTVKKIVIKPRALILLFIALGYLVGDLFW